MPDGMFGSPVGDVAYNRDNLAQVRGAVDIEHQLGQIAMQPQQQELVRQNARLHGAQADKFIAEAGDEKRMGELAQLAMQPDPVSGKMPSVLDVASKASVAAMREGRVTAAMKIMDKVITGRQHEASTIASLTAAELNEIKRYKADIELTGQIFSGVKSQEELELANKLWKFQTGTQSPLDGIEYSPEIIGQVTASAIDAEKKADLRERELARKATDEFRRSRLKQHDAANDIRKAAETRRQNWQDWREKQGANTGGRNMGLPSRREEDFVRDLFAQDYPGGKLENVKEATFGIVSQARALRQQNRALTAEMALQQAYSSAVQSGDFAVDTNMFSKDKVKYTGRGRTPDTAMPVPKDLTQAQVGRYYILPDGRPAKRVKVGNKLGFEPVATTGAVGGGGGGSSADDEEDDDG